MFIDERITKLKEAEALNHGFPDTDLMIQALTDNALFKFKEQSKKNFDEISDIYISKFLEEAAPLLKL